MKTNLQTRRLVSKLRKEKVAIWKRVAEELGKSNKKIACVNLCKLSRVVRDGEVALVLGKVLSVGEIKKMTVAAFAYSDVAKRKIVAVGGEALTIEELLERNPKGNKVRLVK